MNTTLVLIFFIVFILIDLVLIVYVFRKRNRALKKLRYHVAEQWQRILQIREAKLQVLEIEKMFDYALAQMNYTGSFAQKLKRFERRERKKMEAVWRIHKKRNQIAHEFKVEISENEHKKLLKDAKTGMASLGVYT